MIYPNYNLVYVEVIEEKQDEEKSGIYIGRNLVRNKDKDFKKGKLIMQGNFDPKYQPLFLAMKPESEILFQDFKVEIEKGKYIIHVENILAIQ